MRCAFLGNPSTREGSYAEDNCQTQQNEGNEEGCGSGNDELNDGSGNGKKGGSQCAA